MNKPTTYQSQISYLPNQEVSIDLQQKNIRFFRSIAQLLGSFAFVLLVLGTLFFEKNYFQLYIVIIVWSGLALVLVPYTKQIKIDKAFVHLFPSNKKVSMSNRPMIDFRVKIIGQKAQINFLNQKITLKNLADVPVLTENIADLLELEFSESYTFFDESELLVYKSKQFKNPNLPLNIDIVEHTDKVIIIDKLDKNNKFTILKSTNEIGYNYKFFNATSSVLPKTLNIRDIKAIHFTIKQHSLTQKTYFNIKMIEQRADVFKESFYRILFKSSNKFTELETRRTAEYLYQKFQSMDCFKNIEIVKSE